MGPKIRRATIEDAGAIGALHVRAWRRGYADIIDPQHLDAMDPDSRAARWATIIEARDSTTLVAEVAGAVCGFASVGTSREEQAPAGEGELYALYVDPAAQGAGVGTALVAAAEQALRERGHASAVLRVFTENGLARRFYERHGWTPVPGSELPHSWGVSVVLYRHAL